MLTWGHLRSSEVNNQSWLFVGISHPTKNPESRDENPETQKIRNPGDENPETRKSRTPGIKIPRPEDKNSETKKNPESRG